MATTKKKVQRRTPPKSPRTTAINCNVKPETKETLFEIADAIGEELDRYISQGEVVELALAALVEKRNAN